MAHQETSGAATGYLRVAWRSLLQGTVFGVFAAGAVPVSAIRPHKEIDYG
jgi:hypothetical protein